MVWICVEPLSCLCVALTRVRAQIGAGLLHGPVDLVASLDGVLKLRKCYWPVWRQFYSVLWWSFPLVFPSVFFVVIVCLPPHWTIICLLDLCFINTLQFTFNLQIKALHSVYERQKRLKGNGPLWPVCCFLPCSGGVGHYRLGKAVLAAESPVQNRPLWLGNVCPTGFSSHPCLTEWR